MLPKLDLSNLNVEKLKVFKEGVSGIVRAVIKDCPRLREIKLTGTGRGNVSIYCDLAKGLLQMAGLAEKVWLH